MDYKIFVFRDDREAYCELEKILSSKVQVKIDFPYDKYYEFPRNLKKIFC
ncbi:hypothetical protein [Clostridium akagii]|nr:hypothetical protein [Clostridium akagii]